jgi:hypothetical protein
VPGEGGTAKLENGLKLENALMRGAVLPHLLVDEHIGDRHAARRVGAAGGFKTIGVTLLGEVTANALKIDGSSVFAGSSLAASSFGVSRNGEREAVCASKVSSA